MKYNIYRITTLIGLLILSISCGTSKKAIPQVKPSIDNVTLTSTSKDVTFKTGAENFESYLPLLKDKRVGIVTNQTGIIKYESIEMIYVQDPRIKPQAKLTNKEVSIVDYQLNQLKQIRFSHNTPPFPFLQTHSSGEKLQLTPHFSGL